MLHISSGPESHFSISCFVLAKKKKKKSHSESAIVTWKGQRQGRHDLFTVFQHTSEYERQNNRKLDNMTLR